MSIDDIVEYFDNCKNFDILKFFVDYGINRIKRLANLPVDPMAVDPMSRLRKMDPDGLKSKLVELRFFADRFRVNEMQYISVDYKKETGEPDTKLPGMSVEELTSLELLAQVLQEQVRFHLNNAYRKKLEIKNEVDKITGAEDEKNS